MEQDEGSRELEEKKNGQKRVGKEITRVKKKEKWRMQQMV